MSNDIHKDISLVYEKIRSRLINYINNLNDNQEIVLDKLKSIENYIKCKLSKENISLNNLIINEKIASRQESKSLFIDNDEKMVFNHISSYQFIINKLKRKLKEQHEQFKIQELGYLDRISTLQKKLRIYEENRIYYNQIKISKNPGNKRKKMYLLNSLDNKKTDSLTNSKEKKKKINISLNIINELNKNKFNNKEIYYQTYSDLKDNKKIFKEIILSNGDFNNEDSKIQSKNIFGNNYFLNNLKNSKIRNKNINIPIKYNFKAIKKEIEDNKRIIRYLKDGNTPQKYRKLSFKI